MRQIESVQRFQDDTGDGSFLVAVYKPRKCGCEVVGNGTLQHPLTVKPCAKHEN